MGDGLLSFAAGVTPHATPEVGSVTLGRATQPCLRCPCREMMDNIPGPSRCSALQPLVEDCRSGRAWAVEATGIGQCVCNVCVFRRGDIPTSSSLASSHVSSLTTPVGFALVSETPAASLLSLERSRGAAIERDHTHSREYPVLVGTPSCPPCTKPAMSTSFVHSPP